MSETTLTSRDRLSEAGRLYGWEETRSVRGATVWRRGDCRITVWFTMHHHVRIADWYPGSGSTRRIYGAYPAVLAYMRIFGLRSGR